MSLGLFNDLVTDCGIQPEARARMLTDYVLAPLLVFVEEQLDLVQFMFLELILASSRHPVTVAHKDTATLLTGSVDYAIMSSVEERAAVAKSLGVELDKVHDGVLWLICQPSPTHLFLVIGEMSRENSFDKIMGSKTWATLKRFTHLKFTIIEEKRKDFDGKELKDCEPQVVGESLALYVACHFSKLIQEPHSILADDRR